MAFPKEFMADINQSGVLVGKPVDAASIYVATAKQYYPIGTELNLPGGRRFVYCRAAEAITLPHRGSPTLVDYAWIATSLYSLKGLTTGGRSVNAAGVKKLVVEFDDYAHDNSPYAPTHKNFFTGGWCNIFFDSSLIGTFRITGSDPCEADADTAANENITLYFDEPLPTAIGASATMDVYASPYIAQGNSNSGTAYSTFTCVPLCAVSADYFFWGQIKGPCWITPNAGITTSKIRDVCWHTNGTVITYVAGYQRAGYMMYKGDGSQDDSTIMLDI